MAKKLIISGPPVCQQALCTALRRYASAAYPPGCSECGQATRESLMEIVLRLEMGFAATGNAEVSRRLRSLMNLAVAWHCNEEDEPALQRCLEKMISGEPVSMDEYETGCVA